MVNKYISIGVAVSIISFVLSGVSFVKLNNIEKDNDLSNYIVETFSNETEEKGEGIVAVLAPEETSTSVKIGYDNNFTVMDSSFILKDSESKENVEIDIPGVHAIKYAELENKLFVDDSLKIEIIPSTDIFRENISRFESSDGNIAIVGQKKLDENVGLNIVYEVKNEEEIVDNAVNFVNGIISSAKVSSLNSSEFSIFENKINPEWSLVAILNDVVKFSNGENDIYFSKYNLDLTGSGLDNKLDCALDIVYGDYKDAETNLIPYVLKLSDLNIKILAEGNDVLLNFFQS